MSGEAKSGGGSVMERCARFPTVTGAQREDVRQASVDMSMTNRYLTSLFSMRA